MDQEVDGGSSGRVEDLLADLVRTGAGLLGGGSQDVAAVLTLRWAERLTFGGQRGEPRSTRFIHDVRRGEVEWTAGATTFVDERGLVGLKVVEDHVHVEVFGDLRFTLFKKAMKSALVWDLRMSVITVPVATSKAAKRSQVPLRSYRGWPGPRWWATWAVSERCG